jgi:TRAP-type C4-dicarboxylate transport system permease small subunit
MSRQPSERVTILLRSFSLALVIFGLALVVWMGWNAVYHPEIQARQFGRFGAPAPLWVPMLVFTAASVAGMAYIFWRAARRVAAGEDLFGNRFRRRPGSTD